MPDSIIQNISFKSIDTAGSQFRKLKLGPEHFKTALNEAFALSETKALRLTQGILTTIKTQKQFAVEAPAIVDWAQKAGSAERKLATRAFLKHSGGGLYLVHQMALMPRARTKVFMKDFRAAGGDLRPVMEWLRIAGGVLHRFQVKPSGTDKVVVDAAEDAGGWLADKAEGAVDTFTEAVESVVNAAGDTFEGLVEMVGKVVDWAVDKVRDVLAALIEAGKSISDVMSAALQQGFDALAKFVSALTSLVGQPIGDLLSWMVEQAADVAQLVVQTLRETLKVGALLEKAFEVAASIAHSVIQTLLDLGETVGGLLKGALQHAFDTFSNAFQALLELGHAITTLLVEALEQSLELFQKVVSLLVALGHALADILEEAFNASLDALKATIGFFVRLGQGLVDIAQWAANKGFDLLKSAIKILLEVGVKVVDLLTDIAVGAIHLLNQVLDAVYKLGKKFAEVLREVGDLTVDLLSKIIKESLKLGKKLTSFVGHVVSRTYNMAAHFVKAALMAGVKIGELLGSIVQRTYWKLRKMVNGVLKALGPVGQVLDWTLSKAEGISNHLWHETLEAIRYAGGKMASVLDWAKKQTDKVFTAIVNAWENIGENLVDVFKWAAEQTSKAIWFVIGQVWTKLNNSVGYVLTFLEKDFLPGARKFAQGVMTAGATLATLAAEFASHSVELVTEVIKELMSLGHTLSDLMIETIKHPKNAMKNLLKAAEAAGKSMEVIVAAVEEGGEEVAQAAVDAWRELKVSAMDILNAALEVGLGAVGTVFSLLLMWFGVHRPLNETERAGAKVIFNKSIDLDRVLVSVLNLPVELIELCNKQRPFTTNFVLNFASWKKAKPEIVMHELTHVWQSVEEGPFYMSQAIHAQIEFGKDAYNYGFPKNTAGNRNGEGGQQALLGANGDFDSFNREQQGEIIQHYYVRRFIDGLPAKNKINPKTKQPFKNLAGNYLFPSYEEWQPYADAVHA
jgi:phage-related protein